MTTLLTENNRPEISLPGKIATFAGGIAGLALGTAYAGGDIQSRGIITMFSGAACAVIAGGLVESARNGVIYLANNQRQVPEDNSPVI